MAIVKRIEKDNEIIVTYDSSNILASKFNKLNNDLIITFKQGRQYLYEDVSRTDYTRFELAESQGKVFNTHIKNYKNKQIEDSLTANDIEKEINSLKNQELLLKIDNKKKELIHLMETLVVMGKSEHVKLSPESLTKLIGLANDYKQLTHPIE